MTSYKNSSITGRLTVVSLVLLSLLFTSGAAAQTDPKTLQFKPLIFQPPKTERIILENGMILHLYEDHELPLVTISAIFRSGSMYEPHEKTGLASLTGTLMKTGGTKNRTAEQIDETLEFIAGSVIVHIGGQSGRATLSVLKKDLDIGMEIFSDVLINPVFAKEKIELEKNKILEGIRRRNDSPAGIASREFTKIVYEGSPKGRYSTIESISSIKRKDLVEFHKKFSAPNNFIVGVTGDFNKDEIVEKLNKYFKDWKKLSLAFNEPVPVEEKYVGSVNYVEKDLTQTVIRLGHLGIKKTNPDYHTVKILSHILGAGGFTSRLMKEVRSDRGLAYSVWGYFSPGYREQGTFLAGCATKSESTSEALTIILDTIKGMMELPVTDEELATAKESIINSFVFGFTSPEKVLSQRMRIEYFELPEDFLETFRENIDKVTKEDVLKAAKKYLHPDGMTIVVVGNKAKFDRPLTEFGTINTIVLKEHSVPQADHAKESHHP